MSLPTDDAHWMALALAEARKGIGKTAPNPPVGAVIVKGGTLLGSGWHRAAGHPHAEREAIADVCQTHGPQATHGATIYITLEPCSTHGRTPPCTQGIIDAGITRVVYATKDCNPAHDGHADALLRHAGIEVTSGVLADEALEILRPFFKVSSTGLPWVIWKAAMSLDGRLTRPPGEDQWLTGEQARADVQRLRATADAILTTGETVRRDRPQLTIRDAALLEGRPQPWRIVFTRKPDSLPRDAPLFTDEWRQRTVLSPGSDLASELRSLTAEHGLLTCMTEAGGSFCAALFEQGLVDEVVLYYAPLLCGGPHPALAGSSLPNSLKLHPISFTRLGNDIRLRALVGKL